MRLSSLQLWRDRRGRISTLRILTLAFLAIPVLIAYYDWLTVGFGARPLNDVIHRTGYWALVFLMVTLAVTPLRRIARFGQLVDVRRLLGVGAFCYAAAHLALYVADQRFSIPRVASEIALRLYLTIGFIALLGLTVLAATSTDGMARRLGGLTWKRIHLAVYVAGLLALIHFFQQTKADVSVPTFVAGLFGWVIGYRLIAKLAQTKGELSPWALLALTVAVAALTFAGEAIGLAIVFKISPLRVIQTAFDFELDMIRPGWLVLVAGLCVVALDLVLVWWRKRQPESKPAAAPTARAGDGLICRAGHGHRPPIVLK